MFADDADDFDVRAGVGPDPDAMRAPRGLRPAKYRFDERFVDDRRRAGRASPATSASCSSKSRPATILAPSVAKNPGVTAFRLDLAIGRDSLTGLDRHRIVPASAGQQLVSRATAAAWSAGQRGFRHNAANEPARFGR